MEIIKRLITYQDALKKRDELDKFIDLIDNYTINTIEQWIIYNYAHFNSIAKVVSTYNASEDVHTMGRCNMAIVKEVINNDPTDELHFLIRNGYRNKVKKRSDY